MDDVSYIRKNYAYDAVTGTMRHATGVFSGRAVGRIGKDGYLKSYFRNKTVRVHRLIWFFVYGEWPEIVDHINHDKLDNRITNLRSVTRLENQQNRALGANNKSGVSGVYWATRDRRWVAQIKINRKCKNLGSFQNLDDAARARREAEEEHGFHGNHGRAA